MGNGFDYINDLLFHSLAELITVVYTYIERNIFFLRFGNLRPMSKFVSIC